MKYILTKNYIRGVSNLKWSKYLNQKGQDVYDTLREREINVYTRSGRCAGRMMIAGKT